MLHDVLALDKLLVGQQLCCVVGSLKVLLVRTASQVYALENKCPHAGFPLHGGRVDATSIRCPVHGARFDLIDGKPLLSGRLDAVRTYPVEIRNNQILIEVDD